MNINKTFLLALLAWVCLGGMPYQANAQNAGTSGPEGSVDAPPSKPISIAETRIFLDDHFKNLPKKTTIDYNFTRTGSLGDNFSDKVTLSTHGGKKEQGRIGTVVFLTGKRNVILPEISNLVSNPVVLYFLERDVREMERITQGKQNFFRRRIRLALSDTNDVKQVSIEHQGKTIKADEISIQPYLNDPVKARFEKYEKKTYIFTFSADVPGGIYSLRTSVPAPDGTPDAPYVEETLTFANVRK